MKSKRHRRMVIRFLLLFLVFLSLPTIFLGYLLNTYFEQQAYTDVKMEAEALTEFTSDRLSELIRGEDLRPFTEYSLNNVNEIGLAYFLSISPLAKIKPETNFPGVIGYFQIDQKGRFSSPVWPGRGIRASSELNDPQARREKLFLIYDTLLEAELLNAKDQDDHVFFGLRKKLWIQQEEQLRALSVSNSVAKVKGGTIEGLKLKKSKFAEKSSPKKMGKGKLSYGIQEARRQIRIKGLDAVVDPFRAAVLNTGNIVFFRRVQVKKKIFVQGILVDEASFFSEVIRPWHRKGLSEDKQDQVVVATGGKILPSFTEADRLKNQQVLISEQRLPPPLDKLRLFYSTAELKVSDKRYLVNTVLVVFFMILSAGLVWFYALNQKQLELVQRQSDFVSAVSHELRTPLTSIRMHSEMLKFGWVKEDEKKQESYSFILSESERLSRLINNVLSMARIGREQMELNLETVSVEDCYSFICKRIEPQLANSGFELRSVARGDLAKEVSIDRDALMQVFLNLIDNSLKFARDFEPKLIEFSAFVEGNEVVFSVRDHGPGISQVNENKVFDLFYRQENELTRSTTGTGIGLALVKQLSVLMKGQVAYESARPGARFTLRFQLS